MKDARELVAEALTKIDPEWYDPTDVEAAQVAAMLRVIQVLERRAGALFHECSSAQRVDAESVLRFERRLGWNVIEADHEAP